MRIHLATHLFSPRPQGAFSAELAAHWAAAGHEVVLFTADPAPNGGADTYEVVGDLPMPYDRGSLPRRLASRLAFGFAAAAASARRATPDIFVSAGVLPLVGATGLSGWSALSHLVPGRRANGVVRPRMIGWVFDLWPDVLAAHRPKSPPLRAAALPLELSTTVAMQQANDLVTISMHMNRVIAMRVGDCRRPPAVHTIPLWATEGPDRAARTNGVPAAGPREVRPLRAMYHGNLGLSYDFEPILGAAARFRSNEVTFVLVGDGAQRDSLERRIKRDSLTNVELRGPLAANEFTASLESADVHLLPLRETWDGVSFPSKVLPYLAVGRPIVVTGAPYGESAALIRDGECGLAMAASAFDLEAALRSLAAEPATRAAMGAAGRTLYLQRFAAARAFAAWDALIAGPR